ncbi:MAG TPA: hypothetical protein VFQ10_12755, partial [Rubrobacter sp.]|nr:hypothetical protein [Rubrobacter sp.]
PSLFLEFARLAEQRDPPEASKDWISRRGLLGLHKRERPKSDERALEAGETSFRHERWWFENDEYTEYMHEGGSSERAFDLQREVIGANHVLTQWEAFLSGEPERAEHELLDHFPQHHSELKQRYISFFRSRARFLGLTYKESLLYHVGFVACLRVQEVLEAFAYPYLAFDYGNPYAPLHGTPGPGLAAGSWRPRNLLGAMYLQMYQVMISSDKLSQCRYCGRIISYAPPIPGSATSRKPRKDKEFCDSRCRQNYHYHNRIKPRRQSEGG